MGIKIIDLTRRKSYRITTEDRVARRKIIIEKKYSRRGGEKKERKKERKGKPRGLLFNFLIRDLESLVEGINALVNLLLVDDERRCHDKVAEP